MRLVLITLLAVVPALAWGQHDPKVVDQIISEGKNNNQVMKHLHHLTRRIGPRLTTSPQLDKAYEWTVKMFKSFGCQNVYLEEWGEWPVGFERGKRQSAKMIAPEKRAFQFTSPSWSPGTNGPVRAIAVPEPTTMEEFARVKDKLKGAWVVSKRGVGRGSAALPAEVADALKKSGIAGTVFGSRSDLVITSGNYRVKWEELPTEVRVIVRKKDMDVIQQHLNEQKKEVVLEFNLENKFIQGPRKNYNVIADLVGTEKPDEMVIFSGHLDSWDGPGSEGCCDNATGVSVTMEAARILGKLKVRPKRTIRFILWTGEEQGLFGSRKYVEKHKAALEKISAVFVDDGGTNYQGGVTCTAEMEPLLRMAMEPAMNAFPEMPIQIDVAPRLSRFGGSDHAPFVAAGVPAFFWKETGRADYGFIHHTQHDSFEHAIPEYLVQSSTNTAVVAYVLANAPMLLPREKPAAPAVTTTSAR
jgi:hypothetical protein